MSGTGSGVAAALAVAVQAGNPQLQSPVPVFQCGDHGVRLRADRLGRRSAGVRELLRHGNPQSQLARERDGHDQWR